MNNNNPQFESPVADKSSNYLYEIPHKQFTAINNDKTQAQYRTNEEKPTIDETLNNDFSINNALSIKDENKLDSFNEEIQYAEVIFKCRRKKIFRNDYNVEIYISCLVVVEVENGIDVGKICSCGVMAAEKLKFASKSEKAEYSIIRIANDEDMEKYFKNNCEEHIVLEKSKELIKNYNLEMKVTDAEWQFDRQRLTIYFTAPQRIDFRELVKELAKTFKTRIELRQISTREEAKRIDGVGSCGRRLCCTSFASDFCRITLEHARTQQLSNNIAKLSGYCGRLKCCLLYEYDNYVIAFKKYPPLNSLVELEEGMARILKIDIFKDLVFLQIESTNAYKVIPYLEIDKYNNEGKIFPPAKDVQQNKKCYDFISDIDDLDLYEDNDY